MISSGFASLMDIEVFVLELTLLILTIYHCYMFLRHIIPPSNISKTISKARIALIQILISHDPQMKLSLGQQPGLGFVQKQQPEPEKKQQPEPEKKQQQEPEKKQQQEPEKKQQPEPEKKQQPEPEKQVRAGKPKKFQKKKRGF